MKELCMLERFLEQIPQGTIRVDGSHLPGGMPADWRFQARTDGRGYMELYRVFPGVTASFNAYAAEGASFRHDEIPTVLEIHYCRAGRIGWKMQGDRAVYLGAGDLTVHSMSCCADSVMTFPIGGAESVALTVDLERLEADCPAILRESGFQVRLLREKYCCGRPIAIPACEELTWIFAPLCAAPAELRQPYLQLKAQELLLYLSRLPSGGQELTQYVSRQTERIQEIHDLLTEHLDRRYTIEELSRRYLMNSSSLKKLFKAVYGLPIATYMKEYRIHQAMRLLRETDSSIADIAAQVGYESQGKFTQAFKDVAQVLPTVYRRQCRAETWKP